MTSFYDTLKIEDATCPAGCVLCQETCQEVHKDSGGSGIKAVHLPEIQFHRAITCNQCGEPRCEENCPTGAVYKDPENGIVKINQTKCLGCGLCAMVCPYGGIEYNTDKKQAFKCDLCEGDPQCVDACPENFISLLKSRRVVQYLKKDQLEMGSPLCWGCPFSACPTIDSLCPLP